MRKLCRMAVYLCLTGAFVYSNEFLLDEAVSDMEVSGLLPYQSHTQHKAGHER